MRHILVLILGFEALRKKKVGGKEEMDRARLRQMSWQSSRSVA